MAYLRRGKVGEVRGCYEMPKESKPALLSMELTALLASGVAAEGRQAELV